MHADGPRSVAHFGSNFSALLQVAEVKEGDLFRVECLDWTGGQIKDDDSAEDVKKASSSSGQAKPPQPPPPFPPIHVH